jgi:GNS1/SUR4 family
MHQYWVDTTDERLKGYALMGGGPGSFLLIMISWLIFVTKLGPYLMRNRKPFVLREILIAYNLVLVVLNAYFIYASLKWLEFGRKSWNPRLPPSNQWSDKAIAEIPEKTVYCYSKLFDLFETIFFVLRKKSNQISFLHVYHHFMGIL